VRKSLLIGQFLVALILMSGCEVVHTVAVAVVPEREDAPDVPTVVHEDADSMMLWYEKFIGEQKHVEGETLIAKHCGDRNFEIELEELTDSFTMTGTCK
jgi:hypothetical protein